jgi:hypothetical protein
MKNGLLVYHDKIFTDVWHCLFTDQANQKTISEPVLLNGV